MELKKETHDLNLTAEAPVLTYMYTGAAPIEVLARVTISGLGGLGGSYRMDFYINGVRLTPNSVISVEAGTTDVVISSRPFPLEYGDVVILKATGVAGDDTTHTVATLRDVTAAKVSDLIGSGPTEVDHNYGGTDFLMYVTDSGSGIGGASVQIYLKTDYDAGNRGNSFVVARSSTGPDGRWTRSVMLSPGSYTVIFYRQNAYGPDRKDLVVT